MKLKFIVPVLASVLVLLLILSFISLPNKPSFWESRKISSVQKHIDTFSDPVYLPSGSLMSGSTFSSYEGWNNAYQIRYMSARGVNPVLSAYMLQFTRESVMQSIHGEGLPTADLQEVKALTNKLDSCTVFDQQAAIWYCKTKQYVYLIRKIIDRDKVYYLADMAFNGSAYKIPRSVDSYTPQTNGIVHALLLSAKPLSLKEAKGYLKIEI
jgi:hypothetical protein